MNFFSILCGFLLLNLFSLHAKINLDSLRVAAYDKTLSDSLRIDAMYILAHTYIHTQPDSTRFYAKEQLSFAKSTGNKTLERYGLHTMSTYHLRKNEIKKALPLLKQSLPISEMAKDTLLIGSLLNQLGGIYLNLGKLDSAMSYYSMGVTIYEEIGNEKGLAAILGGLGLISKERGDFDQAMAYYERALKIFEKTGVKMGVAMMSRNMAYIFALRDDFETSLVYSKHCYQILDTLGNKSEMASTLNIIALTYVYKKDYQKALEYQSKGLNIHEEENNKTGLATAYETIGMIHKNFGNSALALEEYEKSLNLRETIGDKKGTANALINIAGVYYEQKEFDQALIYYQKALKSFEEIGSKLKTVITLKSIANSYHQNEEYSQALEYITKSLKLARQINVKSTEAEALASLASIYFDTNRQNEAQKIFLEALNLARTIEKQNLQMGPLNGLAHVAIQAKEWNKAYLYAKESLEIAKEIESVKGIRDASSLLWQSLDALDRKAEAFDSYKLFISMRDSVLREENQRATIRFEFKQKALADSLQNASLLNIQIEENKRRKTVSYFLVFGLGITLLLGFLLLNRFRLTQKQKKLIAKEKNKAEAAFTKLKEIDQSKSRFFTNISHEFRTPLTVISGMLDQIKEPVRAKQLIRRNTDQLLKLINQILDLRKLESGNLSLNLLQGDIIKFLRYSTESFESLADDKSISLEFQSDLEEQSMDFDQDKILQIQTNLISNAIKFTPKGGKVEVKAEKIDDQKFGLSIKDTGRGISEEKLPFIFDRFYQVDGSDTREGEGTGIGLALTKELVRLMKGEITVESEIGKGSTFNIILPITQKAKVIANEPSMIQAIPPVQIEKNASQPIPPVNLTGERPSLLIIEDNQDIVEYLSTCLENQYDLITAPDGQAGIEMAFEKVPDLIISDVMMPRKNGYEVCEILKLDERTSHIPIVMLTAKADQVSRIEGYKRGADAYLAKPFNETELFVRLEKLLEIRRTLQQRYQGGTIPIQESKEDPAIQIEDAFLIKARQAVIEHLDDSNYRGASLVKDLGMSRANLHRKIKALTGLSTSHFIRAVRINQAKELMNNPELQISEIAYMAGFSNPGYFNRVFHEVAGSSPSDWREVKE